MLDIMGKILGVVMPGVVETIAAALTGDDDARKRLSMVLPARSRSDLERELDEAAIELAARGFDS